MNIFSYIQIYLKKIKRYHEYGKLGFITDDWEPKDWIVFLKFKLENTYLHFTNNNIKRPLKEFQSLRVCIKVCNRLINNFYNIHINRYYKKWGLPNFQYYPIKLENQTIYDLIDINYYKLSEDEQLVSKNELVEHTILDDKHKQRDINILFDTLSKYYLTWWE